MAMNSAPAPAEYGLVDGAQILIGGKLDLKDGEEGDEARVHGVTGASGRAHGTHHLQVRTQAGRQAGRQAQFRGRG